MAKVDIGQRFYDARTKYNQHNKNGKIESIRTVCEAEDVKIKPSSLYLYEANHDDTGRIPNTKNAQKLADHYGVNVLWLLGKSESWTLDENSQMITEMTGLSPEAVSMLQLMKKTGLIASMNALLESEHFPSVVRWFKTARIINQHCTEADKTTQIDDEAYQGMIEDTNGQAVDYAYFPGESQIDMCLLRATNTISKIFEETMKGDKDNGKRN